MSRYVGLLILYTDYIYKFISIFQGSRRMERFKTVGRRNVFQEPKSRLFLGKVPYNNYFLILYKLFIFSFIFSVSTQSTVSTFSQLAVSCKVSFRAWQHFLMLFQNCCHFSSLCTRFPSHLPTFLVDSSSFYCWQRADVARLR